jgi:hypothetical protein
MHDSWMFFIVWGFRSYQKSLALVTLACRNGHVAAHQLVQVTRKFTLFWIPLFPVSHKYFSVCSMCGVSVPWDKDSIQQMAANVQAQAAYPTSPDPVAPPINVGAGWYPDPAGGTGRRYWDGTAWTDSVRAG